tara:strand:+ start:17506 stop:17985 length:480 start_codon:yes stop_codon:yes gene_type:complete
MEVETILARSAIYAEKIVSAELEQRKARGDKLIDSYFYFGEYAEFFALYLALYSTPMQHGLGELNRFRNVLIGSLGNEEPELAYEITCKKRLSGQSLFRIALCLKLPATVAYSSRAFVPKTESVKCVFLLEQGGCKVTIDPSAKECKAIIASRTILSSV